MIRHPSHGSTRLPDLIVKRCVRGGHDILDSAVFSRFVLTQVIMWIKIAINIHIMVQGCNMRTIQMTLDEDLVKTVDRVAKQLHTSRSAFTRKALREAIARYKIEQLELKHRQGYERRPIDSGEFSVWEKEQVWGDE